MLKQFTPILLVLAIVAGLWFGFGSVFNQEEVLKLSGIVQAVEVKNGNRYGGRVKDILVKEGDVVKKGQSLVVFDSVEMDAKLAEAEATLSQAKAQLSLVQNGVFNAEIGQAKTLVEKAKGDVAAVSATSDGHAEAMSQLRLRMESAERVTKTAESQLNQAEQLYEEGIISKNTYQQALADRDKAQSAFEMASSSYREAGKVIPYQQKAASAQLQSAQSAYQAAAQKSGVTDITMAKANVEKAESALIALEQQLQEVDVRAPIDGVVSTIAVLQGELIRPGQAVVSVVDKDNLWVDVFVPESSLARVAVGKAVTVKADVWKEPVFQGRVASIGVKSEFIPNSGSSASNEESAFKLKVELQPESIDGQSRLYPGMSVSVSL